MKTHAALVLVLVAWLMACMPARAADASASDLASWPRLGRGELDAQRGGFQLPSGLHVSFGFERTVHVNGELVSALRVQVADVSRISAEEAGQLAALGRTHWVRIGGGDAVQAAGASLVVQNALDGQRIQVQSTLDASSSGLDMLQALNTARTLQAATAASVGGL